jgi:hypothetical protein
MPTPTKALLISVTVIIAIISLISPIRIIVPPFLTTFIAMFSASTSTVKKGEVYFLSHGVSSNICLPESMTDP